MKKVSGGVVGDPAKKKLAKSLARVHNPCHLLVPLTGRWGQASEKDGYKVGEKWERTDPKKWEGGKRT